MDILQSYMPLMNFLLLVYILIASRKWKGISIHNETKALRAEVEILKDNYKRVIDDLGYYIRTNGDVSEMLTSEIKAIHRRLDQLNEFHDRISKVEDNCLIHEQAENVQTAVELLKKHNKE